MMHRVLVVAAAMLGVLLPGQARGQDAIRIAEEVRALSSKGEYAAAAARAAKGAGREEYDADSRVLLGGLARENYEKSYRKDRDLHDLCGLAKVMRLVAVLGTEDSAAARQQMVGAAEGAEGQLREAMGEDWRSFCGVLQAEKDGTTTRTPASDSSAEQVTTEPLEPVARPRRLEQMQGLAIDRHRVRAGAATLTVGATLLAPFISVLVFRRNGEVELGELRVAAARREETGDEQRRAESLALRFQRSTIAAAVLGASSTTLIITGAVLLATGRSRPTRVSVAPWGGRDAGGLVFSGKF